MSLQQLSDAGITALHENTRQKVEADRHSKYRFATGPAVRMRAEELRDDPCPPIVW